MGPLPFLRTLACSVAVAGCAAIAGLEEPNGQSEQEVQNPPPPAPGPDNPSNPSAPAPCTPRVEGPVTTGSFHGAPWEGKEPAIDGDFADWACVPRHELGPGVWTTSKFPSTTTARIAFRWTTNALYLYASMETTTPGFANADGFLNDSLNVYLGPADPTAKFRPTDHQFSFDHQGKISHYISGQRVALPATIQATMKATNQDPKLLFELEARMEPSLFGLTAFNQGLHLTLGLQLHDRLPDSAGPEWRTWFRGPLCGCSTTDTNCCNNSTGNKNLIACDLRCTGELVLD